jgi:hypothetical protein
MHKAFYAILIVILTLSSFGCKKSESETKIKIEGFQLKDALGNHITRIGPPDNDWQFIPWTSLSAFEQSLLNSPDTSNTNNTNESAVSLVAYPNPVSNRSRVFLNTGDSVKFKLLIVDESGAVIKQLATKIKGSITYDIDVSDRNIFPQRKSLRYYYSFSAANHSHFAVGYGDIKICDASLFQNPGVECFN